MARNKGYVFTLDAIVAFALLLSLITVFLATQHTNQPTGLAVDALNQKTMDKAIVDNYLGTSVNANLPADTKTGVCNTQYYFESSAVKQRTECEALQ